MNTIVQVGFVSLFAYEKFYDKSFEYGVYPASATLVMVRFMCAIILRIRSDPEIAQGIALMKYVANHEDQFNARFAGFLAGFQQAAISMFIEIFNIAFLLSTDGYLSAFWSYMSVHFVTYIDDYFYSSLKGEPLKKLIETAPYKTVLKISNSSRGSAVEPDFKINS